MRNIHHETINLTKSDLCLDCTLRQNAKSLTKACLFQYLIRRAQSRYTTLNEKQNVIFFLLCRDGLFLGLEETPSLSLA